MDQLRDIRNSAGNIICKIGYLETCDIPVIFIVGRGCSTEIVLNPDEVEIIHLDQI